MNENLSEDRKQLLTELLRKLEARTELEACAVVSKEGMRIACAVGTELDADVYSAASAALANLGETTLKQLRHGTLKEIIVRGDDGYTILTSAGPRHMIVGSCKSMSRMGYYLALLHRFSSKTAQVLGYEIEAPSPVPKPTPSSVTTGPTASSLLETSASTQTPPATASVKKTTPIPKQTYKRTPPHSQVKSEPASDAISEALKILNPPEEPETIQIIEEPEPIPIEEPEPIPSEEPEHIPSASSTDGIDKGALFEALHALGGKREPVLTTQPTSKVETQALMDALKPQPKTASISGKPVPTGKQTTVPFVAKTLPSKGEVADDDLFKISDKEAVLEALKVLGWEEPEDK